MTLPPGSNTGFPQGNAVKGGQMAVEGKNVYGYVLLMDLVVGLNTHDSLADIEAVRMPFTRFPLAYPGAFDALDAQSITLTAKHARAGGQAMPQTPAGTPQSALQSTFDGRAATMTSLQALPWIAGALRGLQAHGSAAKACWRQGGREIRCHRCPVASQAHQWCGASFFCPR